MIIDIDNGTSVIFLADRIQFASAPICPTMGPAHVKSSSTPDFGGLELENHSYSEYVLINLNC